MVRKKGEKENVISSAISDKNAESSTVSALVLARTDDPKSHIPAARELIDVSLVAANTHSRRPTR